jgi:4-amino-4-deoxy-L-arabinose transferase-like glycosyltransferase
MSKWAIALQFNLARAVNAPRDQSRASVTFALVFGWILAGILLLMPAGIPPIDRTQEARVLETAREMLGAGFGGWMIPHLNGHVRLQKPPLAYWMAAGSFSLFGVSEWAGRLPFVLTGWLALGLTYLLARDMFGRRAAVLAALALLGSILFARHTELAETDVLVLAFTQAAVYAFWRAFRLPSRCGRQILWLHAGFAAVGLTGMAKGLPFAFPLLFFIAMGAWARRWTLLRTAFLWGCPLTALAMAAPWYGYVIATQGTDTLIAETRAATVGAGHRAWFFTYIPDLAFALAPWTIIVAAAIGLALRRRHRRNIHITILLLWAASVLVPLCIAGQKQKHYLMPALPPLMILAGWYLDRLMRAAAQIRTMSRDRLWIGRLNLLATAILCICIAIAVPFVGRDQRGALYSSDWVAAIGMLAGGALVAMLILRDRIRPATYALAGFAAVGVPLLMTLWTATLEPMTARMIAGEARRQLGERSYVFYRSYSLTVGFSLRRVVPIARTAQELEPWLRQDPRLLLVVRDQLDARPKELPPGFEKRLSFRTRDGIVHFCELGEGKTVAGAISGADVASDQDGGDATQ